MKFKKLSNKIAIYTIIPFIIVLLFISSLTILTKYQSEKELVMTRIDNYIDLLESGVVSYSSIADKSEMEEILGEKIIASGIINRDNEILYATNDFESFINIEDLDTISQSLDGYVISYTNDNNHFQYFSPIIIKEKVVGVFVLSLSFSEFNQIVVNYIYFIISLNFIGILLAYILIMIFSKKAIVNKILALDEASKKITEGDYDNKIDTHLLSLDDEIGNLSNSFETMRNSINERDSKIKNLLHQKNQFINQLGHDLKSPLTPLVSLLPKIISDPINEKNKERLEIVNRNVNHIKNIALNTLKLAKLNSENIQLDFRDLNLHDISDEIIKVNNFDITLKHLIIENMIDTDIIVHADEIQLKELIGNLINNSIKFVDDGGHIRFYARHENGHITVSIEDTGMGISPDVMEYIFDEFYKADGSRHDLDSSGLGLPICKRIIEKHGGRIWVESDGPGKGSTFYFSLPVSIENKADLDDENSIDFYDRIDRIISKEE